MSWKIRVDWEGNYDYAGESDDITTDVIEASWRLGMHKPFQNAADEAACTVKVRNTDGKYSPEMAGGVLLKPNRRLQIAVVRDSVETVMGSNLENLICLILYPNLLRSCHRTESQYETIIKI